jgi:hypothetical protein
MFWERYCTVDIVGVINPDATQRIVVASALLMGAVVVLFLAVCYYRKRYLSNEQPAGAQTWTFQDLREMRDRGELTEDEYEALRTGLIASFRGSGGPQDPSEGTNTANHDHVDNFDLEKGQRG